MRSLSWRISAILFATIVALNLAGPQGVAAANRDGNLALRLERVAGATRFATAAALSKRFFTAAPVAFVLNGSDLVPGLAAGPIATRAGGPILYVKQDRVPPSTRAELVRLAPVQIVVVGDGDAVSDRVLGKLSALAPGGAKRIAGGNRYGTATALSRAYVASSETVYVVNGETLAANLAAGAVAAAEGAPILLTRHDALPATTGRELARLDPSRIVVVGGSGAVSDTVVDALRASAAAVVRRAAGDRYATSALLSRTVFAAGTKRAFVAGGSAEPDAIAAGAAAGRRGAPVLLVKQETLSAPVRTELDRLDPDRVFMAGGEEAVGPRVARVIQRRLGVCWSGNKLRAGTQQYISSVPSAGGQIALTFDMGGRLVPALRIMDYLARHQVCATIFPTGAASQTDTGQAVLARIRAHPELFEVGNHTMHHCDLVTGRQSRGSPYCPPDRPSDAFVRQELNSAAQIIVAGTGQHPRPYWRAPFGASDAGVRAAAASAGYTKTFQWSIDTIDWSQETSTAEILSRVLDQASSGSIVLMHLGGYHTMDALPDLISGLRQRGYVPTTLSDMLD